MRRKAGDGPNMMDRGGEHRHRTRQEYGREFANFLGFLSQLYDEHGRCADILAGR